MSLGQAFFARFLMWGCQGLLAVLAAVVGHQLLTGSIRTRGLFSGRRRDGSVYFSPERVQLLLITAAVAARYLAAVLAAPRCAPDQVCSLPEFPQAQGWLPFLGGSHAIYLARKAFSLNSAAGAQPGPKKEGP